MSELGRDDDYISPRRSTILSKLPEVIRKAEETLVLADDPTADAVSFWRARARYFAEEILRSNALLGLQVKEAVQTGRELNNLVTAALDWSGAEPSTSVLCRAIDAYKMKYRTAAPNTPGPAWETNAAGRELPMVQQQRPSFESDGTSDRRDASQAEIVQQPVPAAPIQSAVEEVWKYAGTGKFKRVRSWNDWLDFSLSFARRLDQITQARDVAADSVLSQQNLLEIANERAEELQRKLEEINSQLRIFVVEQSQGNLGGGKDPVAFLIASYKFMAHERQAAELRVRELEQRVMELEQKFLGRIPAAPGGKHE